MCIIDCLSTIVFILPLHLDYTKVIILILWWRNFQLEYWRTFQLVSTPYTDEELADYMDKTGLGIASTRTNIIRTLLERKYIRYSGKYIIPTPKGLLLYETVRGMKVADASLTSGWEAELARIEQGELTQKEFLDGVLETVNEVTGEIFRKLSEDGQPHGSI